MATKLARCFILIIVEIFAVVAVFIALPNVQDRFINTVVKNLPTGPHSDYYQVMGAGLTIFGTAPVLGIGPATHRELCPSILDETLEFRCDNHPHN